MSEAALTEWDVKPLSQLAEARRGITYSSAMLKSEEGGLPYINMKSFLKGGGFNVDGTKHYAGTFTQQDIVGERDLLIANTDVTSGDIIGVPALLPEELATEQVLYSHHVTRLRINGEISVPFLYYLLCLPEYRSQMLRIARGTTVLMLDMPAIKRITIRAPKNKTEQDRIVEILTTLDKAIEKTEALIAKYQQIKAGLMHDLFTRGVTADSKLRPPREQAPELYQETPIGWIPKEWQYELLDKLAVRGSGHTPNKNFPEYWNGGIKWISLADSYRLDRLYITETEYEISQLGIQNSSATVHPAGTVVISRDAGIGKSAITTEPMAVSQHFMCWRCDDRLDKYFLYYWLQFKKRMFENIAMGSTILTIGLPYFKKLKIAAPVDPEEQKQIGEGLLCVDRKIFSLEADLEKKKQQKSGLMHDLLTGRVRVKLAETEVVSP